MQKLIFTALLMCLALTFSANAQKIGKPTLTPTEATAEQKKTIAQGIKLHDRKQYDEAITLYQQVLKENPSNDLALYEMALSYYNKPDFPKAFEAAYRLIQYKSDTGVLGYGLIANILDDEGKPKEAISIYLKAIDQLKNSPEYKANVSSLYYNLGVAYFRQKQFKDAREALKQSVSLNFGYASPSYLLAETFQGTKYKIPAMLAAARLISLEIGTPRTNRSVKIFLDTLKPAGKNEKTGNIEIFLDIDAPKDEGDFGIFDLLLGTLTTVRDEDDKNKSENEIFAEAVDTVIALLSEDKKLPSTFVGKTYVPFMIEMKNKGFSKTFAYLVLQQNGDEDAKKWLISNEKQTLAFINWAKGYKLK